MYTQTSKSGALMSTRVVLRDGVQIPANETGCCWPLLYGPSQVTVWQSARAVQDSTSLSHTNKFVLELPEAHCANTSGALVCSLRSSSSKHTRYNEENDSRDELEYTNAQIPDP